MCWCVLLDAGFVRGCTRCEGHVGEVLGRHLPEPRVGEHKSPLSLTQGLTPLHLVILLVVLTTPPGNGDWSSWEAAPSHFGWVVVVLTKVTATGSRVGGFHCELGQRVWGGAQQVG